MSLPKNIKIKDENTDQMIKELLNIKDSNIAFPKDALTKERVHGRMANVFTGILTYKPHHCELCGFETVIYHSYKESLIQLIPYQEVPSYLRLFKQRFYCKRR